MWTTKIKQLIIDSLKTLNLPEIEFSVDHPKDETHGDFASNIAMVLYPKLKEAGIATYKNPGALADSLLVKINESLSTNHQTPIAQVSVAGPGFINVTLKPEVYLDVLTEISLQKENFGKNASQKNIKVSVEYTDPNPFKEFHIGHLYSNIVGETLSRLMEISGATVWRADYFGDVGMHVSKSIWGLLEKFKKDNNSLESLSKISLNDRIKYLGEAYALGASSYEIDDSAKSQMKELNFVVYVVAQRFLKDLKEWDAKVNYQKFITTNTYNPDTIFNIYKICRTWSLDYFETIYRRLGTVFNGYYPESMVGEYGYKIVQEHLSDIFEVGEGGAVIFPGKKYGLHDRVFINSLGLPTYECKELGLAPTKFNDFAYDKSIIVTGNEINEYFKVLIKALTLINPALGTVTNHLGHGMVRLPEGKMSSRTGKVITGIWLLDSAQNAAEKIIDDLNPDLPNKAEIAEMVGMAAIRYALLKTNLGKDVVFNFEESVSFNGNSGPYLQYTVARANSVLNKKAAKGTLDESTKVRSEIINAEELAILKQLARFEEIVVDATKNVAPHIVCEYCYDLAQRFNTFYNQHSILGGPKNPLSDETKLFRLQLTYATQQVLKNALSILGISCPEKM